MTPRRSFPSLSLLVRTLIPASTGVVHDAGHPLRPSTSMRHRRHEPNAAIESVAHNFGIAAPASAAARKTDVPSGTLTGVPSISREMSLVDLDAGVPRSLSSMANTGLA